MHLETEMKWAVSSECTANKASLWLLTLPCYNFYKKPILCGLFKKFLSACHGNGFAHFLNKFLACSGLSATGPECTFRKITSAQ